MRPLKPPVPDLEDEPIDYSVEDYKMLPFPKFRWQCCVLGCEHYSTVKDVGKNPLFWWHNKLIDLSCTDFFCRRHWNAFQRSGKNYELFTYKDGPGLFHLIPNTKQHL